ncbi:MAG: hypothetical protein QN163_10875 [Armatimonadota bacterium]|nr:hypothetical protein [Armatimonadota bacterium]
MSNRIVKGFRFYRANSGEPTPRHERCVVASGYASAIHVGFPVKRLDDGTFNIAAAGEAIYGIVAGIDQFFDATDGRVKKPLGPDPKRLPAGTTYSGVDRASVLTVIPVEGNLFEVDLDTAISTPTRAGAVALLGSNANHVISGDDCALNRANLEANDASPASANWRTVGLVEDGANFAAARLKYIVRCNTPQNQDGGVGL